ncbi:MAG: Abi family protein [Eubacterium sp.]|nr:Abi family protein [Eubacterium sp.]
MDNKKQHQKPMTIEEQVQNLKALGLIINDEEYAKKMLNDISYFRLIKAYSLNLKPKNGNYYDDITFERIVELYLFNSNFRQILFPIIEMIEINTRCRISNYFANKYGVLSYKDSENFVDENYHQKFLDDIEKEIEHNKKSPFVRNFKQNYEGGELPIYALVELCSFGMISQFYKNMKNEDKKAIAKQFGIGYTYLQSWLESISYLRNICAHYGRLYNAKLSKSPTLYKQYTEQGISNYRVFGLLLCIKHIMKKDRHWEEFVDNFEKLLKKYKNIDLETMGFPYDWRKLLLEDS